MTADGRFVYVANRGHDSLAGFAIDQQTGRVRALGQTATEQTPRSFTIDPSGRFLYAAGEGSGRIAAYRIEPDGALNRLSTYDPGPVPWCVLAVDVPPP
jgi:6-phosphogluconolactonase